MHELRNTLLLLLLTMRLGNPLSGQTANLQSTEGKAATRGMSAEERALQQQEQLLQQELLKFPDFKKLSRAQKKHLQVYWQAKKLRLAKKYDHKKDFEPQFQPIAEGVADAYPALLKVIKNLEEKEDEYLQSGKQQLAAKVTRCVIYYREMAKTCQSIISAYKEQNSGKIYPLMTDYRRSEILLTLEGMKVPKREWLTTHEAEMLSRTIANQNKNKQN